MNALAENKLIINYDVDNPPDSFARLEELGTKQGHVTYENILHLFPEAEQDVDYLAQIYVAILEAGILFIEDDSLTDAPNEDSADDNENETNDSQSIIREDHLLSNVETDNLVGLYFCEVASGPLLTFEEEVELAKRIEQGLLAREEMSNIKNMSAKRREELLYLIDDSWTAVDHLITANSRLVISIAKRYAHRGVPFLDLIQEGNIGLMRAVKRFDYKRGYKFSTYATWWIRQAVSRALAEQSRTIRLPVHISGLVSKMFFIQHQLSQQLGRDPDVAELADTMGLSSEKIRQMSKDAQYPLSIDMPISFEDDSVLGDYIEDYESPDPDEATELSLLRQHIDQVLVMLPPREVQILKLRFGLTNGETHSLAEVGLKIGVSRERVRQIEAQAIRRLRQPEIQVKLRSYLSSLQT
ncbi:MAG TPA: sigma-70 family RNA polymerase sigma factor [Anaerolineales bacterium]|nr:sigma-70 family RNA polymerase sigma factor [Anaerolineales bacterium]